MRGAQALGFEAEARDHLSLEEVEQFTTGGRSDDWKPMV